jgi:hypothetical protein
MTLAEPPDTRQGWCCDGRTWKEHADADGTAASPRVDSLKTCPRTASSRPRSD